MIMCVLNISIMRDSYRGEPGIPPPPKKVLIRFHDYNNVQHHFVEPNHFVFS